MIKKIFLGGRHKEKGLSFGSTSAVITTLGMIVGLDSATSSVFTIIAGIITIAIADSLSDALGVHMAEEIDGNNTEKHIWLTTLYAFLGKFFFTMSFIIPFVLFSHKNAILASIVWGFAILLYLNYCLARKKNVSFKELIIEHFAIVVIVIVLTYIVGIWISGWRGENIIGAL